MSGGARENPHVKGTLKDVPGGSEDTALGVCAVTGGRGGVGVESAG